MPLSGEKKPLYLAKSIRDLNKLANTPTGPTNLRILAKSTQMLLRNASERYLEGDQENAYVLYMRFFNVITCIKKSKDYTKDKSYYDMLIGDKNCKMAIERAEELSEELNKRYDELRAMELSKKLESMSFKEKKENGDEMETKVEDNEKPSFVMTDVSAPFGWVTVQRLYEWFKNGKYMILLADVRSKDQFDSSHINSFRDVINIPQLLPGMTAKNVEMMLTGPSLSCWGNRSKYDIIVICDFSSTNQTYNDFTSPMAHLKAALVKWDLQTTLKSDPLFLLGGYKEWAETFPMLVNKPLPREEFGSLKNNNEDVKTILDSIDYDIDLSYLTTPIAPAVIENNITSTGVSVPLIDRTTKPKNDFRSEINNNSPSKTSMTDRLQMPSVITEKSANNPIASVNMKPNFTSSPPAIPDASYEKNIQGIKPPLDFTSKTGPDNRMLNVLKGEIEELEEKKQRLEKEVADMDRKKAILNETKKSEVSGDEKLAHEKAKQAREVAGLLREKRKLAQELNSMSQQVILQRLQILNGNHADEISSMKDNVPISNDNTTTINKDQPIAHKFTSPLATDSRSSSPPISTTQINAVIPPKINQPIVGSNSFVTNKIQDTTTQKVSFRASRDPHLKPAIHQNTSDSPRASPKRHTLRIQDPNIFPKSKDESSKTNLKRFHSFPNIAKLAEEAEDEEDSTSSVTSLSTLDPQKPQNVKVIKPSTQKITTQPPRVDRSIKPVNSYKSLLEAKVRNFQPLWGSIGLGLTGLRNLGNTCYMNSIIQCLSNCQRFCTYFLDNHHSKDINWSNQHGFRGEVAIEFAILIKNLWTGQYKAISPINFRAVVSKLGPMFASTQHQDAQELLEYLMNGLNEDLNRVSIKQQLKPQDNSKLDDEVAAEKAWREFLLVEKSVVVDLFRGQYKSQVMCSHCETRSTVFEPFMSLTLQIPENQNKCCLSDCLLHFSNEEKMTGDSKWLCPQCKQKREATKRIVVWRLPEILVIHLKRFHYQGIWRNKISTNVSFPVTNLDMSRYLSGPRNCEGNRNTLYNLFAVCNHYGTLDGGHYTAYCKNVASRNWYKFDDSEVSEIPPSSILSPAAYLLFYTKVGAWPGQ